MKKKVVIILLVILVVLAFAYVFLVAIPESKNEVVRSMKINNVDLSQLEDGAYSGEYAYGHYTYKVDVEVNNHKITQIDVSHGRDSKHAKAAEGVIDRIIKEQEIDVDVVSGATTTSKAILKAVENALSN